MTGTRDNTGANRLQLDYDRRWSKHIAALIIVILYLALVAFGLSSLEGRAILMIAGVIVHALYQLYIWRCPNCRQWLGNVLWRTRCPQCGERFSHAINFGQPSN